MSDLTAALRSAWPQLSATRRAVAADCCAMASSLVSLARSDADSIAQLEPDFAAVLREWADKLEAECALRIRAMGRAQEAGHG